MRIEALAPTESLEQFAVRHNLELVATERSAAHSSRDQRWYVRFKDSEVKGNGTLIGTYGDGATPELAARDYAKRIVGQVLVIDAWTPKRREIQCPNEFSD